MPPRLLTACTALLLAALALMLGCGGGGGAGTSGGGGGGNTVRIEAIFTSAPSAYEDIMNIMSSDSITFQLASYDALGARTVLSAGSWITTDSGSTAGILDGPSGMYTATTAGGPFTISTSFGGQNYQAHYLVTPVQARMVGQVVDSGTGLPIPFVTVWVFDGLSNKVGSVTSAADGFFRASVPTSAAGFNLDPASINGSKYYKVFSYNSLSYSATIASCDAPVPAGMQNGHATNMPSVVALPPGFPNPPPGPPTGCGA